MSDSGCGYVDLILKSSTSKGYDINLSDKLVQKMHTMLILKISNGSIYRMSRSLNSSQNLVISYRLFLNHFDGLVFLDRSQLQQCNIKNKFTC